MDIDNALIGRRVRELRSWRTMNLSALAGLAGMSVSYLSMIERGERPVTKRATLEALARALQVSPTDLTGKPWEQSTDQAEGQAHASLVAIAAAMDAYELGDDSGEQAREWPQVAADVRRLVEAQQIRADYAEMGGLIPQLLSELHTLYVRDPVHRREILLALVRCYSSAVWMAKLGRQDGLTLMAAMAAQRCSEELGSPQWRGYTTWLRGVTTGSLNRAKQYQRATAMADELAPGLNNPEITQAYGQLHLSAALAAAAQADRDTAATHLDEAAAVADRLDHEVGTFAQVWFGRTNVRIWRVTIGVELGDGPALAEIARDVHVDAIPSPARQAVFHATYGRALLAESRTRDEGLAEILRAEHLAPQHIRGDVFVRESVADELRRARRDAGGRELRGLAWRMGVAPTG
ncbi:helix-turn-helix domain-containing protein [Actinocrispum wychmicini]|uniref:Transcriptional regulator with XRE-family HTH domain n=1 Tax=Actinocrispum wychmicini TaxID=1213861 RepID=A0A4R2JFT3_9PSEU|nr:helix-turn-helix transcriptional regulator [Actinocrispum wychmicini]TCO57102.1 transcriptional regulator with XRE-family HTH domain [Actinocrispum wychmicini]